MQYTVYSIVSTNPSRKNVVVDMECRFFPIFVHILFWNLNNLQTQNLVPAGLPLHARNTFMYTLVLFIYSRCLYSVISLVNFCF